jgi:hypothetical protein
VCRLYIYIYTSFYLIAGAHPCVGLTRLEAIPPDDVDVLERKLFYLSFSFYYFHKGDELLNLFFIPIVCDVGGIIITLNIAAIVERFQIQATCIKYYVVTVQREKICEAETDEYNLIEYVPCSETSANLCRC